MTKTTIKLLGLSAAVLLLATSCQKALEEDPKSLVVENFYNTPAEVEAAVNAIYPPIRLGGKGIGTYNATLICHTDYAYGRGSWAQFNDFAGFNTANINRVADFWTTFYLCIRNANLVIGNAPNGNAITEDQVNRYVAEAKFMRAWMYFNLVRNWGGVPLRTDSNMTVRDLPRSSADEVYGLIERDLLMAETYLPDNPPQLGRPTKWAAKTMYCDVLMNRNRYDEARDKALEVINANKYSLVPVASVDDFEKIFGADTRNSTEEIFHLKYNRQGQGNYFPWIVNHPSTGFHGAGGAYAQYGDSQNPFYQHWNNADLRKGLWYPMDFGLGTTTLLNKKFIDPAAPGTYDAINDFPVYRYPEVLLMFAESAARENGITPEALEALNKVHRRAYGYDPASPSGVDYGAGDFTPASFIDTVLQEKAYEFQFEGKRWFDLKRSGKAAELILANKGKNITESHYLWPLPVAEMNYNHAINPATDQNPGY